MHNLLCIWLSLDTRVEGEKGVMFRIEITVSINFLLWASHTLSVKEDLCRNGKMCLLMENKKKKCKYHE